MTRIGIVFDAGRRTEPTTVASPYPSIGPDPRASAAISLERAASHVASLSMFQPSEV
jgi:hypothetical protein